MEFYLAANALGNDYEWFKISKYFALLLSIYLKMMAVTLRNRLIISMFFYEYGNFIYKNVNFEGLCNFICLAIQAGRPLITRSLCDNFNIVLTAIYSKYLGNKLPLFIFHFALP